MNKVISFFSLFGSIGTLLCCALPVTLVTLGMGASFASLTSTFPQVTWLTMHKNELFVLTGVLLFISFILMKQASDKACPIDLKQKQTCMRSRSVSKIVFWISIGLYITGLSFSFIIPRFIYGITS